MNIWRFFCLSFPNAKSGLSCFLGQYRLHRKTLSKKEKIKNERKEDEIEEGMGTGRKGGIKRRRKRQKDSRKEGGKGREGRKGKKNRGNEGRERKGKRKWKKKRAVNVQEAENKQMLGVERFKCHILPDLIKVLLDAPILVIEGH